MNSTDSPAVECRLDGGVRAHTPGPWRADVEKDADRSTRLLVRAIGTHSVIVCRVTPIIEGSQKRWAEEDMGPEWRAHSKADANLIAAAPELLEAAQAAWNCVAELPPTKARSELALLLQRAIDKAIAGAP